ncbi:hypothetical protein Pmani_030183 [Petrolisthes manimaculis]|uniref:DUF1400 domain-containing protein n=1 Tax=Petrolisthes manimaculis TaxID=1843537 RepID=A0AAE1TT44_9EUCA|nr:hypothetical protein Pmani_030183 [Petrolisthes manimaculis]
MLNLLLYACPMLLLSTTTFTHGFSTRLGQTYTQDQRYQAIIHALPHEVFSSLSPVISTFNQATVYEELISAHGMSTQQYLKALKDVQLDGPQHSELLQHMQQLNEKVATAFNDDVLKSRYSKLLPTEIQLHLQAQPTLPIQEYGKLADVLYLPLYLLLNSNQRYHHRSQLYHHLNNHSCSLHTNPNTILYIRQ